MDSEKRVNHGINQLPRTILALGAVGAVAAVLKATTRNRTPPTSGGWSHLTAEELATHDHAQEVWLDNDPTPTY